MSRIALLVFVVGSLLLPAAAHAEAPGWQPVSLVPALEAHESPDRGEGAVWGEPESIAPSNSDTAPNFQQALRCEPNCCPVVEKPYRLSFGAYGWLPEMYGQAGVGNADANIAISQRDVLNFVEHNAHFAFSGQAELEYGAFSVFASGLYLYGGFGGEIRRFSFSGNTSFAVVDSAVGYELAGIPDILFLPQGSEFELIAGARTWLLGGAVTVTGPRGNSATRGNDVTWVDPVVGGRLTVPLGADCRARIRADIGGFGWGTASQQTWNVEALIEKRLCECISISAGYRLLDVDYERGSGRDRFMFDTQLRGPVTNLSFEF